MRLLFAVGQMLRFEIRGGRDAARHLDMLRLTPSKRRTVLRSLGRIVRANSKKRVQSQNTVDGGAMAARSPNSKGKGRMLKGLGRRMLVLTEPNSVRVKFRSGRVAYQQQHGDTEKMTAEKMRRREGGVTLSHQDPCTRRQARRLRELGYKIRRGSGWKKPTVKWITANLKMGQAGRIIRILSNETPKTEWDTTLPARPFLGVAEREHRELRNTIANALLRAGLE